MTLPSERARSILYTREFLVSLTDPKATPKVPKSIRQKAIRLLRHYPWECHIKEVLKDND